MKMKGRFICLLLVVDTFFVSYAIGFNSRSVLIVDPSLPAFKPAEVTPAPEIPRAHPMHTPAKVGTTPASGALKNSFASPRAKDKTGSAPSKTTAVHTANKHGSATPKHSHSVGKSSTKTAAAKR